MAKDLVSEGGYQLRDTPRLIKPLTTEYALAHAVADDNLFIYLVGEMNEGNNALIEVRDGVYLFEANRPDSGVNVFSQKANDRIENDFSYMRNFVWGEGESFYFDNEGGMACVWRTDITRKTTERIIPVESIKYPYYLQYRGGEMVVATDTDDNGSLYIAMPDMK